MIYSEDEGAFAFNRNTKQQLGGAEFPRWRPVDFEDGITQLLIDFDWGRLHTYLDKLRLPLAENSCHIFHPDAQCHAVNMWRSEMIAAVQMLRRRQIVQNAINRRAAPLVGSGCSSSGRRRDRIVLANYSGVTGTRDIASARSEIRQ